MFPLSRPFIRLGAVGLALVGAMATTAIAGPYVYEDDWSELNVEYDARRDGLVGTHRYGFEVLLLEPESLEAHSRIAVTETPFRKFESAKIRITSAAGEVRELTHRSLEWVQDNSGGGYVHVLDRTRSVAVIPGLRKGDRLRVELEDELEGAYALPDFRFGGASVPTALSRYELTLPADHELLFELTGPEALVSRIEYSERKVRTKLERSWVLRELDAARDEDMAAGPPAQMVQITAAVASTPSRKRNDAFAVGRSWEEVGRGYLKRVEKVFEANSELEAEARAVLEGKQGVAERIDALYRHVQERCRYLAIFEGLGGVIPIDATRTHETGYGDCKGLSTLLIAMLRASGIDAHPALVRTRSADIMPVNTPNMGLFNHYIAWADDGRGGAWLDPTYDGCPAELLPLNDTLNPILLLHPEGARMVTPPDSVWARQPRRLDVEGTVSDDGRLELVAHLAARGYDAMRLRSMEVHADSGQKSRWIREELQPRTIGCKVTSTGLSASADWKDEMVLTMQVSSRGALPAAGDQWFLPRELVPFPAVEAVLDAERARALDLRLLPRRVETWTLALPDGATVEADSFSFADDRFAWECRVQQRGGRLELHRRIDWAPLVVAAPDVASLGDAVREAKRKEAGLITIRRSAP